MSLFHTLTSTASWILVTIRKIKLHQKTFHTLLIKFMAISCLLPVAFTVRKAATSYTPHLEKTHSLISASLLIFQKIYEYMERKCMYMNEEPAEPRRGHRIWDLLELELQEIGKSHLWEQGTPALHKNSMCYNCWAISPAHSFQILTTI